MAFEVVMPKLGWASESARLVEWVKQEGDQVEAGDVLFIAEGDKAAQEVEALESGTLCIGPAGLNLVTRPCWVRCWLPGPTRRGILS